MEIVGLSAADSPRLAVHGRGGSRQLLIHLYAKDSQGHRALSSPEAIINNAPNNPSAADFITVSLESRLAGAVSFDIAHRCSDGSFALVGSAVTLPYRIEAAPACPGNYQPPGYNESAAVNLRAPQGIRALGPFLAFTDNTYDIGASGANRPRTGYFATSVVTPKLAGITDSGTVINLNADRVDGHHASDFTAAPVSAPRSSRAACAPGQWAYDSGYIYVCTATNTWKRSALAAW
jgi:hypothetical protein